MPNKKQKVAHYKTEWEKTGRFAAWVTRGETRFVAKCEVCPEKVISLGNMGVSALASHARSAEHLQNMIGVPPCARMVDRGSSPIHFPDLEPVDRGSSPIHFPALEPNVIYELAGSISASAAQIPSTAEPVIIAEEDDTSTGSDNWSDFIDDRPDAELSSPDEEYIFPDRSEAADIGIEPFRRYRERNSERAFNIIRRVVNAGTLVNHHVLTDHGINH